MEENIKNLFLYLREIYKLRMKVVGDYKDYEKSINLVEFYQKYTNLLNRNGVENNEVLRISYINDKVKYPQIPTNLSEIIRVIGNNVEIKEEKIITEELRSQVENYKSLFKKVLQRNKLIDEVNGIYEYFYDLNKRKEDLEEKIEIILGKGLFVYKYCEDEEEKRVIRRHVVEIPLKISIAQNKNVITLSVDKNLKEKIEYNFLSLIPKFKIKNEAELLNIKSNYEEGFENCDDKDYIELYKKYLSVISFNGECLQQASLVELEKNKAYIIESDDIIVRKRPPTVWYDDINRIVNIIENGKFSTENIFPKVISEREGETINEFLNTKEKENEDILFPLVANDEQYRVVELTNKKNMVLVQGPPGTGKTQTIANLISNYVAQGKRILVTSEKYKALDVIREKLPPEIRDLTMTVSNDKNDKIELANSVRKVLEKYQDYENLDLYIEKIKALTQRLKEVREQKVRNHKAILKVLVDSTVDNRTEIEKIVSVHLENYKIMDVAKYLNEFREYDYIEDMNEPNLSDLSKNFLLELNMIADDIKPYINYIFAINENLPENIKFDDIENAMQKLIQFEISDEKIKKSDIENKVLKDYNLDEVSSLLVGTIKIQEIFGREYVEQNCEYEPRIKKIKEIIGYCMGLKAFFENMEGLLIGHEVVFDKEKSEELLDSLGKIHIVLDSKSKLNLLSKIKLNKELKIVSTIYLDNESLKEERLNIENINLVEKAIKYNLKVENVKNNIFKAFGNDKLLADINEKEFSKSVENIVNNLKSFVEYSRIINTAKSILKTACLMPDVNISTEELQKNIKELIKYKEYLEILDKYNNLVQELQSTTLKFHSIFNMLIDSTKDKNIELYIKEREQIEALYDAKHKFEIVCKKHEESKRFKKFIKAYLENEEKDRNEILENYNNIITYYKLKMFLFNLEKDNENMPKLLKQKEELQKEEKHIIIELISTRSWYNQIKNMTTTMCNALAQWQALNIKYGAGNRKNSNVIRREMQEKMEIAKDAIPIWIMSADKVVEQYPYSNHPQFDILIMDESSQSSVISFSVLLRGKKNIIVGDDKQISPISVGINVDTINALQIKYLRDTNLGAVFDMETSIYDLAQLFCGSAKIVLKEHFRCLPEIIGFSNINFYAGEINCLKVKGKENNLGEPIKAIYVPDGTVKKTNNTIINEREVEETIKELKRIEADERYNEKTLGIIVLQNSNLQINKINTEILKNFSPMFVKERKIKVGTTYDFQGDERDVIILLMLASKTTVDGEENEIATLTKKEYCRSFNVATSRAKEQMILIYSVRPEELSKECLRYKLITYCTTYNRIREKEKEFLFESVFEKDFYKEMKKSGYELIPQFRVGKYRIDFVVENEEKKKVAIECDGDIYHTLEDYEKDMARQGVLERCGWKFVRIRASQFYYDRENSMRELIDKVKEYIED